LIYKQFHRLRTTEAGSRLDGRVVTLGSEEDIGGRRCLDQIHAPPLHVSMYVVVACLLKLLDAATILMILCFATKRERERLLGVCFTDAAKRVSRDEEMFCFHVHSWVCCY
jgi:hypothetical protein